MKGVDYIIDEAGHKKAVIIDLKEYAELWEDMQDMLEIKAGENDKLVPIEEVEAHLKRLKKL